MHQPLITIIIATFNAGQHLARCLDSIAAQTWPAREIIIQDGGSTDSTAQIAAKYTDLPCSFASEPDQGSYDAWNKALARVTGEWVLFLGADDQLIGPEALACVAEPLSNLPRKVRFAYTPVALAVDGGETLKTQRPPQERIWRLMPHGMVLPHPGTFHRRELFHNQRFSTDYRIAGDYEFVARALKKDNFALIDCMVTRMNLGGISSSLRSMLASELECLRASRIHYPRAFPWRLYLRILRAGVYLGVERTLGKRYAAALADIYRIIRGKRPLWKKLV